MKFEIYSFPGDEPKFGWELINSKGKVIGQCCDLFSSRPKCVRAVQIIRRNINEEVSIVDQDPDKSYLPQKEF